MLFCMLKVTDQLPKPQAKPVPKATPMPARVRAVPKKKHREKSSDEDVSSSCDDEPWDSFRPRRLLRFLFAAWLSRWRLYRSIVPVDYLICRRGGAVPRAPAEQSPLGTLDLASCHTLTTVHST